MSWSFLKKGITNSGNHLSDNNKSLGEGSAVNLSVSSSDIKSAHGLTRL